MGLDQQLLQAAIDLRTPVLSELFLPITAFGSAAVAVLVLVWLWHSDDRETAILATVALLAAAAIEHTANLAVSRPRPAVPWLVQTVPASSSFPSGHATVAFTLATVLAARYRRQRVLLYAVAVLVAVSRVYIGVHYPSDVAAGAVLGLAVGLAVRRVRAPLLAAVPDRLVSR